MSYTVTSIKMTIYALDLVPEHEDSDELVAAADRFGDLLRDKWEQDYPGSEIDIETDSRITGAHSAPTVWIRDEAGDEYPIDSVHEEPRATLEADRQHLWEQGLETLWMPVRIYADASELEQAWGSYRGEWGILPADAPADAEMRLELEGWESDRPVDEWRYRICWRYVERDSRGYIQRDEWVGSDELVEVESAWDVVILPETVIEWA